MAFDDSFRPRYFIHERDTFQAIGKAVRVPEIRPNSFDGPIAEWANYRETLFNDKVVPVMTIPEGTGDDVHRVAWVYHEWQNPNTGMANSKHHIACDCCMMAELSDEPESIYDCPILQKSLNRRASFWRATLLLDKLMKACRNSEESRSKITLDSQFFVTETIMWILKLDRDHPECWVGNITSGEHSVSLLSLVLQEPPDNVREIVEDLAYEGRVELENDGEIVRLPLAA